MPVERSGSHFSQNGPFNLSDDPALGVLGKIVDVTNHAGKLHGARYGPEYSLCGFIFNLCQIFITLSHNCPAEIAY